MKQYPNIIWSALLAKIDAAASASAYPEHGEPFDRVAYWLRRLERLWRRKNPV